MNTTEHGSPCVAPPASRRARNLLQLAHQAIYRLPAECPGFVAGVRVRSARWSFDGRMQLHGPHGVTVTGDGSTRVRQEVTVAVTDMLAWQMPRRFSDGDGRFTAAWRPELDRPSGRAVEVVGDPRRTLRWLDENGIVESEYLLGSATHRIAVVLRQSLDDGRWVPALTHVFVNGSTSTPVCREYVDSYVDVDGVTLPARREVTYSIANCRHAFYLELCGHAFTPTVRRA